MARKTAYPAMEEITSRGPRVGGHVTSRSGRGHCIPAARVRSALLGVVKTTGLIAQPEKMNKR